MFVVLLWLSQIMCLSAAENYVGAHLDHHPEKVADFVENLPYKDRLAWKGWLYLQKEEFYLANQCFYELATLDNGQGYKGLADSYLAGQGVSQSTALALIFYEKAAAMGVGSAQINAAVLRADQHDWKQAKKWFEMALVNPDVAFLKDEIQKIHNKRLDGKE